MKCDIILQISSFACILNFTLADYTMTWNGQHAVHVLLINFLLTVACRLELIMLKSFATILFQNSFIALLLFPLLLAIVLRNALEKRSTIHMDTKNWGKNINDGCIEAVQRLLYSLQG